MVIENYGKCNPMIISIHRHAGMWQLHFQWFLALTSYHPYNGNMQTLGATSTALDMDFGIWTLAYAHGPNNPELLGFMRNALLV